MPWGGAEPPGTLEAKWRQDCLAFARVKKLDHVADMRIFYVVSPSPSSSPAATSAHKNAAWQACTQL